MKVWVLTHGFYSESSLLALYEEEKDAIAEARRLVNKDMTRALRALSKKDPFVTVWQCEYLSDTVRIWREHSSWAHKDKNEEGGFDWNDGGGEWYKVECYELHSRVTDLTG